MKKKSTGLFAALVIAFGVLCLSACTTTGTSTASVSKAPKGEVFENPSPEFSIRHPSYWNKGKLGKSDYLYIETGEYALPNMRFSKNSFITDATTPEQGGQYLMDALVRSSNASGCKVLYSKAVVLSDGTPAIETEVQWNHPQLVLYTCSVLVKKGDVGLTLSVTDMKSVHEQYKAYLRTIIIK